MTCQKLPLIDRDTPSPDFVPPLFIFEESLQIALQAGFESHRPPKVEGMQTFRVWPAKR